jgi:hypothetical protein
VRLPGRQAQRVAAVAEAAVDARDDAAAVVGDAAHRVDELREAREVDLDDVVDLEAEVLLDGADHERGAADRVGGVDLVGPRAGDVHDGVAGDGQLGRLAAARALEQDRVGAAGSLRVRAGLGGALRATVRAEDERGRGAEQAGPPGSSACSAWSETCWPCTSELTRKARSETSSHATTSPANQSNTRPTVI